MSILATLLFSWILAGISAGYNPVTLTQNGKPLATITRLK